jgi:hypothetical protein
MEFDPTALRLAFTEAGKPEADELMMAALDQRLQLARLRYRKRLGERQQASVLREAAKSLETIRDAAAVILNTLRNDFETGTCTIEVILTQAAPSLNDDIDAVHSLLRSSNAALEYINDQRRGPIRRPETWLYIEFL